MLKTNVGSLDRIIRIVLGVALLAGFFLDRSTGFHYLYLIGVIPLVTGLMQTCPLYSIFGITTCKTKS